MTLDNMHGFKNKNDPTQHQNLTILRKTQENTKAHNNTITWKTNGKNQIVQRKEQSRTMNINIFVDVKMKK